MFGIKTKILKKLDSILASSFFTYFAKKELAKELSYIDLQSPIAKRTNRYAAKIIKATANYMPNNLGNWSIKKPYTLTGKIELQLIEKIKKYYSCPKNIIGHFGSGTTEGNIYAAWIGRNYLIKKLKLPNSEKIILIKSCLAHYSIDKAADIVGIKMVTASIDEQLFHLDEKELDKQLNLMYRNGFRGFIIPLTLGYTVTGTDDNYKNIIKIVNKFKINHLHCEFFLWLDAAFSGISKIFTEKDFQPFASKNIQLLSTDFHKFLAVPYPASVMLYRRNLLQYIQKEIPYIDQLDTTLLGSRSGTSVLATWMSIMSLKNKKMKKIIAASLSKKEAFLKKISNEALSIKIINNKNSMQACLISQDQLGDRILASKYKLKFMNYKLMINGKNKIIQMYNMYFLPSFK